ncbi:MAG: helix-turn-helix domain-containing protein [Nitrospira sp.]
MPSNFLGTKGQLRNERPTSSLIKPHLKNLSGSGTKLDGMIIERDVEQPNSGIYRPTGDNPKHIVVLHSAHPATLEWRFNGRQEEAFFSEGEAIINPAGLFVAPRWKAPVELLLLAINPSSVNQVAREMGSNGHVELKPLFHFRDELLEQLAKSLIAEFEQISPLDRVYADSLTHTLIVHLIKKYSGTRIRPQTAKHGLPQRSLARVVEFIDTHLDKDLSLSTIAHVAEMSPSYFLTLFKRSTGLAPHRYLMAKRIERARALLTQTKLPIADIATQSGFADQSHLTRLMRRHTGLTPRLVRGT